MSTRGIRNHNWGNIRVSGINWHGESLPQERTPEQKAEVSFEVFREPVWGIRAMAINLRHYWEDDGLRDIDSIVSKWAPKNENDTKAYIESVVRSTGLDARAELDLDDPDILRALILAMVKVEVGSANLPENHQAVIKRGVLMALNPSETREQQTPAQKRNSSLRRSAGKIVGGAASAIAMLLALGIIDQDQADALTGASESLITQENIDAALLILGMVWGGIETVLSLRSREKQL